MKNTVVYKSLVDKQSTSAVVEQRLHVQGKPSSIPGKAQSGIGISF